MTHRLGPGHPTTQRKCAGQVLGGLAVLVWIISLVAGSGCAPRQAGMKPPSPEKGRPWLRDGWQEHPVPDGVWRPHLLLRCLGSDRVPEKSEGDLAECWSLYSKKEGAEAIMWLELFLEDEGPDGLVLLTLGQLYMMAGQGEPMLLPKEGPAADVGDWSRNKRRLLKRADELLRLAARLRPDDAAVDYLLADVARARSDTSSAQRAFAAALLKCSLPRSLEILEKYQGLNRHAARMIQSVTPEYPAEALQLGLGGEVVLDLLLSPSGQVEQVVPVTSPDPALTAAAASALRQAQFAPARVGKYPIWSWLRVPTRFSLAG